MFKSQLSCGAAFRRKVLLSTAVIAGLAGVKSVNAITSTWIGAAAGNWNLGTNWSGSSVPNSSVYDVLIDNGNIQNTTVTLDINVTIGNLTISSGDKLAIGNNLAFGFGPTVSNAGTIALTSGPNHSYFQTGLISTLTGGGTIVLDQTGGGNANVTGTGALTNVNNMIRGQGNIGLNSLTFTNQANVIADVGVLTFDAPNVANGLVNTGTMAATSGGILQLTGSNGGGLTNTGGTLSAANGSQVLLINSMSVTGGTLTSSGTGAVTVGGGHTAYLSSFTNIGNITTLNNSATYFGGATNTNTGSINISAAANNTYLYINGTQATTGAGTINMTTSAGGAAVIGGSGSWTVSNTIQGAGNLGNNSIQILNSNLIQATSAANGLTVDPAAVAGGVTNSGTMLANGGILYLSGANGGDFVNTTGRIISGSTDVYLHSSAGVSGGTLASTGAGAIRVLSGHSASITNLANTGNVIVENNSTLYGGGTISNSGSMTIAAGANPTYLHLASVQLSGGGTVNLNESAGGSAVAYGTGTVTNTNNFFRGSGNLGLNSIAFINQASGVVQADVSGKVLVLDPSAAGTAAFSNQGNLRATSGGILQFTGANAGGFDNTGGTIQAQTGSEVRLVTSASIIGGSLGSTGTGTINVLDGNTAYIDTLSVSGTFNVGNNARAYYNGPIALSGVMRVNSGANPTYLTVNGGSVTVSGSGSIVLNRTGGSYPYLDGSGTLTLNVPVSGAGFIGNNSIAVNNTSTITSTLPADGLAVDPAGGFAFTNTGTVSASIGNVTLTGANGGTFENTGGRLISGAGDIYLITGAYVNGGTLASTGAGAIRVPASGFGQINALANTGKVILDNNADLYITGTITNTGSISINPVANTTRLYLNGGIGTLTGAGTVFLNTGTTGGQAQISGGGTLVNNQHIRGGGNFGVNSIAVINNGTVTADNPVATLLADPANVPSAFINNGTMTSTTGVLQFTGSNGGAFDNTAGRIISGASDIQMFTNASITGGTLSSTGAGAFHVTGSSSAFLNTLTTSASIMLDNNTDLYLAGTIANTGSISINPAANTTRLLVNSAPLNMTGAGTIFLSAGIGGSAQIAGGGTLVSSQFIRGCGSIGVNSIALTNNSTILADVVGVGLLLDPVNVPNSFITNGTYASSTGVLQLTGANGGAFDNTSGRIISGTGDVQFYSSASVTGGTLSSTGAGALRAMSGHSIYFTGLTNAGNVIVENNADLYLASTITNTGSITVSAAANTTRLLVNSASLTLNGGGTVNLTTTAGGQAQFAGGGTLNNINNLIRGQGGIGVNQMPLVNTGTIAADVAATSITLDPPNVASSFTNNGYYRASNGGQLYFTGSNGGGFVGTGTVDVQTSSFATFDTSTSFTGNTVINNGTVTAQNSSNVSVSSIAGNGTLNVTSSALVTVRANGTQAATSKVVSLSITNPAKLDLNDNALVVDYTTTSPLTTIRGYIFSGYNNAAWNGNGIISTASIGSATLTLGYAEASQTPFTTTFRGQSFAGGDAVLVMRTIKGDANLDRTISSLDFNQFVLGYGKTASAVWSEGDFDYNGKVNTIDFNWLAGQFGQTLPAAGDLPDGSALPGPSLGSVVPEPATISLLCLSLLSMGRRRR